MSSVDYGYIQLGLNLYETSYRKFQLYNHLFVSSDPAATKILKLYGANAVDLWNDKDGEEVYNHSN